MRPQLLFTAGMTLVDSVDSVLMLYSYSGFPERGFALFEKDRARNDDLAVFDPATEPLLHPRAQASIDNVPPSVFIVPQPL